MKIRFDERKISKGPLLVLKHFYYYTAQYGLSVKQFTGAHQDYWRTLPNLLKDSETNPRKLKKVILELETLAEGHKERLRRRRLQFRKWKEKEIIINAQLVSILAALPRTLLPIIFRRLTGVKTGPQEYRVVELEIEGEKGEDKDFVEPDLLLWSKEQKQLLMVEIKTRGGSTSSRSYPLQQLLNYMRLALECQNLNDDSLPNQFSHLILVPTTDKKWLEDHSKWALKRHDTGGNRIYVDPDACIKFGNKYTRQHSKHMCRLLTQIPIYYHSWQQLGKAFDLAVVEFNDRSNRKHWERLGNELKDLSKVARRFA